MQVGVIGLGNIGGHVAANLVTDGHDVVVFDVDAARAASIDGARAVASVADVGAASEVTVLSLPDPGRRARGRRRVGDHRGRRRRCSSTCRRTARRSVRELGARLTTTGHHLVEAPLTGGAIGAQNRMLSFMVGGDDDAVARVQPVLEPLGRSFVHLGALGLGNTMKLVNSLIAFTTTWVSLEGLSIAAKSGDPGAGGGAGAAHQRRRQLLPRPHGREHRHPRTRRPSSRSDSRRRTPASSSRPAAPSACRRPRARPCSRCWWARSPAGSATTTGATSSPPPNARATSSSTGTPDPPDRGGVS